MSFESFISRRLAFSAQKTFSRFIIRIAIAAVGLSLGVMIIAISLVNGFQQEISSKIFGFWGHVHITPYGFGQSFEDNPMTVHYIDLDSIRQMENVRHVQVFGHKAGIIKTADQIEGIVLKGVGTDFDWDHFNRFLDEGEQLTLSDTSLSREIIISAVTAKKLRLKVGDKILIHFIDESSVLERKRQLTISGIYHTGLEEYDEVYALVDMKHIQTLNDWNADEVNGFEVFLNEVEPTATDEFKNFINMLTLRINGRDLLYPAHHYYDDLPLFEVMFPLEEAHYRINSEYIRAETSAQTLREIYPNIFDWLALQNMNKYIILLLMIVVAIVNMITCLLILILERTNMIGILKALGATNRSIRKVFLYHSLYIVGFGLLAGNIFGLGLCYLQQAFGFIQLPEESYYVSEAPVVISYGVVLALNIGTIVVCFLALQLPSYLVYRISPVKAIRFS